MSQHQNTQDQRRKLRRVIGEAETTSREHLISFLSQCLKTRLYHFRISPEESKDDDAITKQRRGKSAPHASSEISRHVTDKVAVDGGVQSPPDPLEPWSTRDIKSINNILDTSDRD